MTTLPAKHFRNTHTGEILAQSVEVCSGCHINFATTEAERMMRKKHRKRKQQEQKIKKESDSKNNSVSEDRLSIEQDTIGQGVEDYFKPKAI